MTSKELVRRVVRHQDVPRIAWNFNVPEYDDIQVVNVIQLVNEKAAPYRAWGEYEELKKRSGFHGEVCMDMYGNILGRLHGKTKGECVLGALDGGLEDAAQYAFPTVDMAHVEKVRAMGLKNSEKYILSGMPFGVFSTLRDLRRMDNALMDVAAEPELVAAYLALFTEYAVNQVVLAAESGIDGIIIADDWGMQYSPFISPKAFRELFKPVYKAIGDACHARDVDFMLHSCGWVLPLVEDMLDAGVDVLQFDQIEAGGSAMWAETYGHRAVFFSPVDIQRVLPTGDRALIEATALNMVNVFKKHGGGLIAKDYPTYHDIGVEEEWAKWARDVIVANSAM